MAADRPPPAEGAPWRAGLAAACVLVPLWVWRPEITGDWRLDGGLLSLLVLALAASCLGRRVAWLPGTGFFLAAVACGLLPLLLRAEPPFWGGLADRAPLLAAWMLALLAGSPPVGARRCTPWVLGGVALASWYGICQIAGWDPLGLQPEAHSDPVAPFPNTNAAAEVLAPILVLAAARVAPLGSRAAARTQLLWLVALMPMAFHLGFLGVTAARVSVPLGLVLVVARERKAMGSACIVLGLLLVGELVGRMTPPVDPPPAQSPAAGSLAVGPPAADDAPQTDEPFGSLRVRVLMWEAGLGEAVGAPLGIGLGRFELDYPFWRPPEELRLSSADYQDVAVPRPATPHDEPVLAVLELGWAGALLLGVALWRALRRAGRDRWTTPGLLALGVHALVRSPLTQNPIALALGALMLGLPREAGTRAAGEGARPDSGSRVVPAVALLVCLVGASAAPSQLAGEWAMASYRGDGEQEPALRSALEWRPWDAVGWYLLAVELGEREAGAAEIRGALLEAIRHDPANLKVLTTMMNVEGVSGNEAAMLTWMEQTEAVAPAMPLVVENRNTYLKDKARHQRNRYLELMREENRNFRELLVAGNLLDAWVEARRGDLEAAREQLRIAGASSEENKALIERTARREDLDPALVRELAAKVLPEIVPTLPGQMPWDRVLGPPRE